MFNFTKLSETNFWIQYSFTLYLTNVDQCSILHFLFFQVETELIDKLDILVSENKGDQEYKQLFNSM